MLFLIISKVNVVLSTIFLFRLIVFINTSIYDNNFVFFTKMGLLILQIVLFLRKDVIFTIRLSFKNFDLFPFNHSILQLVSKTFGSNFQIAEID